MPPDQALADSYRNKQWHLKFLEVAQANAITEGDGVVVAVVDTGVDAHQDLSNNLLPGHSVAQGQDERGDPVGHGTAMASLIAAHGRGGRGVVGIAPRARILPVKDTNAQGNGDSIDSATAINWAATHNAHIINFSGAVAPSLGLNDAIKTAAANDVLVVAAAGNKSQDIVAAYPAAMPGVLSVGASNRRGSYSTISSPGKNVQLCAPGVDIESAYSRDRYWNGGGTSQAAAIASGAAALVRAKFPDLSAPEVIHRLTATATDTGKPGRDGECGYGVLNIVKALTADVPPLTANGTSDTAPTTPPSPAVTPPATEQAAPNPEPAGVNTPIIAGAITAVVLIGGLVAFLAGRRRRKS